MKQGWEIKKLGDAATIVNGGTPKTGIKEYWDGKILWITPKDMGKLNSFYVNDTTRKITELGLKKSSAKLIPENSIIVSTRAPIGYLALNKKTISTNQGCKGIVPQKEINNLYLFYFLKNSVKLLNELGNGTTFKELSGSKLSNIPIPIPPLPEQKRIVAILDRCFEAIDKARANVERNLQNAKDLFQSQLNQIFTQKGDGWVEKKVDEVSTVINGFSFKSTDFASTNKIKSIKITNVGVGEFVQESDNLLPKAFENDYHEIRINCGDIVMALTRTIISGGLKVAMVPDSYEGALLNQRVAAIVSDDSQIDAKFLYLFLRTETVSQYVLANVNTLMQPNLSIRDLKRMPVPLPSLNGQRKIVERLDELRNQTQALEAKYQQELDALDELKKSILQKAFNGELTAADEAAA